MALAFPSTEFSDWVQQHCTAAQRLSIQGGLIPDLGRYGLPRRDPDLIRLVQGHVLPSALQVDVFVWPERITSGLGRTHKFWFGIVEVRSGPPRVLGRWLVAKAWARDPRSMLVQVEKDLLAIAAQEFP